MKHETALGVGFLLLAASVALAAMMSAKNVLERVLFAFALAVAVWLCVLALNNK